MARTVTSSSIAVPLVGATAPADGVDGPGKYRSGNTPGLSTDGELHRAALEEEGEKKKRKKLGHDDLLCSAPVKSRCFCIYFSTFTVISQYLERFLAELFDFF